MRTIATIRAEFETWVKEDTSYSLLRDDNGLYIDSSTRHAFAGWLGCATAWINETLDKWKLGVRDAV